MTMYGTIPSASAPGGSSNMDFISRAKERMSEGLATRRPWKEMIHRHAIGLPSGFADAVSRIRTNLGYFLTNYTMIVLVILFLSLLWHPISLIVMVAMMAAWLFLYFMRDEPLVIMNRMINDRWVLVVLSVVTIVALLLTHATANILVALLVGAVVVLIHAVFRKTDDLFLDEEAAGSGGYFAGGAGLRRPLHDPSAPSS